MRIFKMEFRRLVKGIFIWTSILGAIGVLFLSMFPSMADSTMKALVDAKIDMLPSALLKAFNMESLPDFTDLLSFFAYCHQFIGIALCVFAGINGAAALISEETGGTIEFLYARPVSRASIVTAKAAARLFVMVLINAMLFLITLATCYFVAPEGYQYFGAVLDVYLYGFLAQISFFAIGLALSTVLTSASAAAPAALGVFFISYILGIAAEIIDKLHDLVYVSIFDYVLPGSVVKADFSLSPLRLGIMLGLIVLGIGFCYVRYAKKDLRLR